MAFKLRDRDYGVEEVADINVTPFIDVILVLLIIFMVAAPLSTVDVPVELPAASVAAKPRTEKPVFVTIKADGTLAVGEADIERSLLAQSLAQAMGEDKRQPIYLRADKTIAYGILVDVMNELRQAGYSKVALVALEKVN